VLEDEEEVKPTCFGLQAATARMARKTAIERSLRLNRRVTTQSYLKILVAVG
jgi:hypothetical protein